MLKDAPKNNGASAGGKKTSSRGAYIVPRDNTPTYADIGLDKKTAGNERGNPQLTSGGTGLHW